MDLTKLKSLFADKGCKKIYVKKLSPNDNSKNQVYLGGSFDILNIFPIKEIINEPAGDWNRERFKVSLDFSWIDEIGGIYPAPDAKLILYPKYPEVRFSGFLIRCKEAPSELMTQRLEGRLLFLSVDNNGRILGFTSSPDSEVSNEFCKGQYNLEHGVFHVIEMQDVINNKARLFSELKRIYDLGWIQSKRLDGRGNILPCRAPNCGGFTLEAELGITPNGFSEPDFLGWEIKQFGVSNFDQIYSSTITLMTPEPTNGYYASHGAEAFVRKYGYPDTLGRVDRLNFGGIHKAGIIHDRTKLKLIILGFDNTSCRIRNSDGRIALIDSDENEAASWGFASMLKHWNRKHHLACYIPSLSVKSNGDRKYRYGNKLILGLDTEFPLFLNQMAIGNIYYDPGIKLENASSNPRIKKRSQFRIKSVYLEKLYKGCEIRIL